MIDKIGPIFALRATAKKRKTEENGKQLILYCRFMFHACKSGGRPVSLLMMVVCKAYEVTNTLGYIIYKHYTEDSFSSASASSSVNYLAPRISLLTSAPEIFISFLSMSSSVTTFFPSVLPECQYEL